MSTTPLPQGMSDVDYEAIEAAVTETVRGRWFLKEFAHRNRGAEVAVLLEAMGRLETLVRAGQPALPPPATSADPSIRLLMQRIKEISSALHETAGDLRDDGLPARLWQPVEAQARAVAGLMRNTAPTAPESAEWRPPARLPATVAPAQPMPDPRLSAFATLEALSVAEKLALFT